MSDFTRDPILILEHFYRACAFTQFLNWLALRRWALADVHARNSDLCCLAFTRARDFRNTLKPDIRYLYPAFTLRL